MSNILNNNMKCSTSKGYAIIEAIQDDKRKYMKYPEIAPQFETIPSLHKSYIINNKASLPKSSLHHIAPECVPIFHETYQKTKNNISHIIGRLTQNPQTPEYTAPKTNIAIGNAHIIKENNPYSISNFGNFPLERLYTDAESLTHIPQKSGFFGSITKKISMDLTLPWNRIAGEDIFKHTEDYLLKQQDKELQTPETKDLYREAFGLSQPLITNITTDEIAKNYSVPPPNTPSSDDMPVLNPFQKYNISNIINDSIDTIQSGATKILNNTKYIGQDILKEMRSLNTLAIKHPLATTIIGLSALGLLYKTFTKQNKQDTKDEAQ